jgi:hypothetical protein
MSERTPTFSSSKERRHSRRLDHPIWITLRLIGAAGRLFGEERTVALDISPTGARVATSMWWLAVGDTVEVQEIDRPFRNARAEILGTRVGPDGKWRLNLRFVSRFASRH